MTLSIILLAAGHGTRMNSKTQKILHAVGGKPMIMHLFEAAEATADKRPLLIVGAGADALQNLLGDRADYAVQAEKLGTGHAVMMAKPHQQGGSSQVIVAYGDMPLLKAETMRRLADQQAKSGAAIVMLSLMGDPDTSFGRVVRDENGRVSEIIEVAEAKRRPNPADYLSIPELNAGVYCFDADWLWDNINNLPIRQARSGQEYYLTDMVETAVSQEKLVEALISDDADECLGAGTRAEMVDVEKAFRRRANGRLLAQGVTIVDPDNCYIDQDVIVGQDTVIWPGTYLQGKTAVGKNCSIGPNTVLNNATIGDGCTIAQASITRATVPTGMTIKPFTTINNEQLTGSSDNP